MKLDKSRFTCWECIDDDDYENKYDDELIINVNEGETNRDIADYILECQEKADNWDKVSDDDGYAGSRADMILKLSRENKELREKADKWDLVDNTKKISKLFKENEQLKLKIKEYENEI